MLRVRTCLTVRCDQCGEGWPGGVEPHWPTEDLALAALAAEGWHVAEGRVWCRDCAPVLLCEERGHEFGPWRALAPAEAANPTLGGRRYRLCERCCLYESGPAESAEAA